MRLKIITVGVLISLSAHSQTLGGSSTFNFLKLSNTPQLTGLGGVNVSQTSNDVGMVFFNPALLQGQMHTQINAVFNSFYADIKAYHLSLGYHNKHLNTNFLWGLQYLSYGNIRETDASGNILGSLRPTDWVMQFSASRTYREKWRYGAALKFVNSNYGQYSSNGIGLDVGVLYQDTGNLFSASVVGKNMGFQMKSYGGTEEDMPFDLVVGATKRLAHAPVSFSISAHHVHQFDIRYNDTTFDNDNFFGTAIRKKKFTFDKVFRHFVLASQIYIGDYVEVSLAYNHLRRQELNVGNGGNGLNGFSVEVGALFNKIQIRYAKAYYQSNTSYNQFGLNLQLNKYFGLGKLGERMGW